MLSYVFYGEDYDCTAFDNPTKWLSNRISSYPQSAYILMYKYINMIHFHNINYLPTARKYTTALYMYLLYVRAIGHYEPIAT